MDGGRVAAGGYLYQYWRTVEAVLIALASDDRVHACRVEGDPYPFEVGGADIVDFDLIDRDGKVLWSVQVKSGAPEARLHVGDVFTIFARLVAKGDAEKYVLLTNTEIGADAAELARILALNRAPAERLAALRPLLRGQAERYLAGLTDEQVRRLGRCEIAMDRRNRTELRNALLQAVREVRRTVGQGVGTRSSGLLLAYLHSEIHWRAATPEDAEWAMSDIRNALHLDDHSLVVALGERDWGGVVGPLAPIPDVPRTELIEAITGALKPFRPAGRMVDKCALTGLSGIGKSSLAAWYVAEYLDAYDMVFWIDASKPPYTLVQGFRAVAGKLGVDSNVSAGRLRTAVHERLSRLAARWLIVFDDATAAAISSWVPRIGDGDVLITSIDSTGGFGVAPHIPVGSMSPAEAANLLAARLELTADQALADAELIARLAAALEYWPLALELAAGYLRSCGYTISDIPYYIETLKLRSLDDWSSIPEGYPATLIAAINLAAGRLAETPGTDQGLLTLAANIVMEGSYLSTGQIPVHLLVSAGDSGLDTLPGDSGPIIFDDPVVHEAVRSLRRVSFVRLDEPLPRRETDLPTAERTIAMNSVLQEVMRARAEKHPTFPSWKYNLERLAHHLDHWLSSAIDNGEADKAHLLVPHADTLVHHLRRLGLTSGRIAVLIGNLAGVYVGSNDLDTAVGLLETELQLLLDAERPDEFLVQQVRLYLAQALVTGEQSDASRIDDAIGNLEHIAIYAQRLAADVNTHERASRFCLMSLQILDGITHAGYGSQTSQQLSEVFADMFGRLPTTRETQIAEAATRASAFISAGQPEQAERACRTHMTPLHYGSNAQLELQRMLLEALVQQGKWDELRTELAAFAARLGNEPLYRSTAEDALHNIGLPLAVVALTAGDQVPADLFAYLMSIPCFVSVLRAPRPSNQGKFGVLGLALAITQKSRPDISRYVEEVRCATVDDPSIANNRAWLLVAQTAIRLAGEE